MKILIFICLLVLIPTMAIAADPCEMLYRGDVYSFVPTEYTKFIYDKNFKERLYYIDSLYRLDFRLLCPYDNSYRSQIIDEKLHQEALYVGKNIITKVANEALKTTNLDKYLKFKLSLDLTETNSYYLKKKERPPSDPLTKEIPTVKETKVDRRLYLYFLMGLQSLTNEQDIYGNIVLGETMRIGLSSGMNYIEPSYNIMDKEIGLTYKRFLWQDNTFWGAISTEYKIPVGSLNPKDGKIWVNYLINF